MTGHPEPSPVTIRLPAWGDLADALLRGLAHSLSNGIGALMALADLGPGDFSSEDAALLAGEIDRLQQINRMLKLLPADLNSRMEAILPADVVSDAIAIMAVHPRGKDVAFLVDVQGDQPVRVERWALLRLTLIVLDTARELTLARQGDSVNIKIGGDDRISMISASPAPATPPLPVSASTDIHVDLLARTGALCEVSDTVLVLRMPTLLELRRRERGSSTTA